MITAEASAIGVTMETTLTSQGSLFSDISIGVEGISAKILGQNITGRMNSKNGALRLAQALAQMGQHITYTYKSRHQKEADSVILLGSERASESQAKWTKSGRTTGSVPFGVGAWLRLPSSSLMSRREEWRMGGGSVPCILHPSTPALGNQ